jgi:hypothetical protein
MTVITTNIPSIYFLFQIIKKQNSTTLTFLLLFHAYNHMHTNESGIGRNFEM